MQLLFHSAGAVVTLQPYQLTRWRCPVTFTHAGKLAGHLQMVHGRSAGKDIYIYHCNAGAKTFPRPERVRRHAECEHRLELGKG